MTRQPLTLHELRTLIVNGITAAVAFGLLANLRRNREIEPQSWPGGVEAPLVEIIIPARNEESNIAPLLASLAGQEYPVGRYQITVVDDGSTDGTAKLTRAWASRYGHVRYVAAAPLPAGWTGKNHALWTGLEHAADDADWLLFVDADTRHHRLMLASVVLHARGAKVDLLSLITHVQLESFWERLVVPQVGELYTLLVGSMDAVNASGDVAAANGQFILVRPELYREVGSLPEVRSDVAEDRALAAACKSAGAKLLLHYGRRLVTSRVYSTLPQMWRGYSKTLFWASGHNTVRAVAVALALGLYALAPLATLFAGAFHPNEQFRRHALRQAGLQLAPMLLLRVAVCKQMGVPPWYAAGYPLAVLAGNAMLLHSLYRVLSGRGVQWKGRTYYK